MHRLEAHGLERGGGDGKVYLKVLYFIQLAQLSGSEDGDEVTLVPRSR